MESKRTYRDAAGADIKLPREVYYRCLWTVRDSQRLGELAAVLSIRENGETDFTGMPETAMVPDDVAARAAFELECIRAAVHKVPEVYREGLLDNIIGKTPFDDFAHPNTWKRWKLVFLYELAKELRMI